jgi:Lrp/AsnC family transcriptional regulator, leucine-responsive regulatory protein
MISTQRLRHARARESSTAAERSSCLIGQGDGGEQLVAPYFRTTLGDQDIARRPARGPAVSERVARLEEAGVITGYRAIIDPRALGYQLTAIVRVKPAPGQLQRIPELALQIPEIGECHRITGEDCFYLKLHLRSIDELTGLLDRFLAFGETTTSIINASPILHREPPIPDGV